MHSELYGVYLFAAVFGIATLWAIAEHYWQEAARLDAEDHAREIADYIDSVTPTSTPFSERLKAQYGDTKKERIVL